MATFQLKKATRSKVKMRLNISAPAGGGKTYSALLMAYGITGDWSKIAVIDTENSSASLYEHLGAFNVVDLRAPFSPERYIECINLCVKEGMEVIIIDSSSHEWDGIGGCKDINQSLADSKFKGNTWSAWSVTSPRHDRFVEVVLQCPAHVITCTRSKTETVMTEDKKVKKIGMKDMQREGWEYELTISFNLDRDTHKVLVNKDRTNLFEHSEPFVITAETGKKIKEWCELGIEIKPDIKVPDAAPATTPPPTNGSATTATAFISPLPEAPDFITVWTKEIAACDSKHRLMHLYNNHQKTVDASDALRKLFKDQQAKIDNAKTATA